VSSVRKATIFFHRSSISTFEVLADKLQIILKGKKLPIIEINVKMFASISMVLSQTIDISGIAVWRMIDIYERPIYLSRQRPVC
jgi:hypothetical protein